MNEWTYANSGHTRVGTMKCSIGNHQIDLLATEFRYRKKSAKGDWYYVCQCRQCSRDAAGWEKHDRGKKALADEQARLEADAIAFYKKWGVTDISDIVKESNWREDAS